MFAVIYVPDFHLQSALRMEAQPLHAQPAGLIDQTAITPVILQLTQSARESGVLPGMTVTQAMARCPGILIKRRASTHEEAAHAALLDCAWAFSPNVERTADGVCTLDLSGHRAIHYEQFGARMLNFLLRLRLAGQIGIAENPLLAWHAARAARPCMVVRDAREFLHSLPIDSVEPSAEARIVLRKWGVCTLGDFLALGKNALAERLGVEGMNLFDRASATGTRPLRLATAPQVYEEAMEFEHEVETAEALLFVLHRFVEQLSFRLELVYLVAEEMTLRLTLSNGEKYETVLKIPAPTRKIETLFGILQTHLETLRTEQPIIAVHLSVRPCRPAKQQLELFESDLRDPNRFYETLGRLTALLGNDRVGTPIVEDSYQPDAFRMEPVDVNPQMVPLRKRQRPEHALKFTEAVRGPCLRRFRRPQPAAFDCRVVHKAGPWHLSGHWWDQQRWSRTEWDIETEDKHLYRVFQQNDRTSLEGMYD